MEVKHRIVFAFLGAIGMSIIYGLKVNLSVAIVAMVNQTALQQHGNSEAESSGSESHGRPVLPNNASISDGKEKIDHLMCSVDNHKPGETSGGNEDGPLLWTEFEEGLVLGAYFWGYLVTQVPAGRLSELYGGKWVFWLAVLVNIVAALLSPVCSSAGYEYLIIMRILMGLGGGVTFPAMNVLIARWAPEQERSTMSAIVYGGTSLGTVVSITTSGLIAGTLGWEAIFYIHGGLAAIWLILWGIFITDGPYENRFVSDAEKQFIRDHSAHSGGQDNEEAKPPVPWKSILTSVPFWSLCLSHTLNNFGWYMLLVELPMFMRTGLGLDIKQNAIISAVPFLCNWLFSIGYGRILDKLVEKKYIRLVYARKISTAIASVVPAACLVGVSLSGCNKAAVIALMIVGVCFYGTMFSGVFSNHTDIAPNYAGLLMGITNMVATIPGFAVPAIVGVLTHDQPGLGSWHTVFYLTSGLLFLEFIIFTLGASASVQDWNNPTGSKKDLEENHDCQEYPLTGGNQK